MTSLKLCEARPVDGYLSICGEIREARPCERGTLRVGVFFDGTGNHMRNPSVLSNVAKLARIYRIDADRCEVRWLYVRGIGTSRGVDPLGGAFGKGGQDRIVGALYCLQQLLQEFQVIHDAVPTKVVLDVFGFSRGAALARHFVNVIKQGAFDLDAEYQVIPKEAYRIGFLGVFDTVSSFGMPGNDSDRGYTFHIEPHWIEAGGLHLIADDEHRANFSLQAMISGQDLQHPLDMEVGRLREVVLPGAHSDIGGGYSSEQTQGQANNELGKIGLVQMYAEAKCKSVPVDISYAPEDKDVESKLYWHVDQRLKDGHSELMNLYRAYPDARRMHRRWRVLGIAAEKLASEVRNAETARPEGSATRVRARERELQRDREILNETASQRRDAEKALEAMFAGSREFKKFMALSEEYYAAWVHKSHSPYNRTIGMRAGVHGLEGRRAVFFAGKVSMDAEQGFRRAAPRAFTNGAWVDRKCLEVHRK